MVDSPRSGVLNLTLFTEIGTVISWIFARPRIGSVSAMVFMALSVFDYPKSQRRGELPGSDGGGVSRLYVSQLSQ